MQLSPDVAHAALFACFDAQERAFMDVRKQAPADLPSHRCLERSPEQIS